MGKPYDAGMIVFIWDPSRVPPGWRELGATGHQRDGALAAFFLVQAVLDYVTQGDRAWGFAKITQLGNDAGVTAGVYYIAQARGAEAKTEWFPEGTRPTWDRLLAYQPVRESPSPHPS